MASEKQRYDEWRTEEVKRVGIKTQREAEAILDKQEESPFVERNDEIGGRKVRVRRRTAGIGERKREMSKSKTYIIMPGKTWLGSNNG